MQKIYSDWTIHIVGKYNPVWIGIDIIIIIQFNLRRGIDFLNFHYKLNVADIYC